MAANVPYPKPDASTPHPPTQESFYYYMPIYVCSLCRLRFVCSIFKEFDSEIL
jgi:hypothetical protein